MLWCYDAMMQHKNHNGMMQKKTRMLWCYDAMMQKRHDAMMLWCYDTMMLWCHIDHKLVNIRRMSNIFRDSESLGKSNGKKWSQVWTFLFENCLKSPQKKKVFFSSLFSLLRYSLTVFLPPLPEVGCPIFLEIRNPWGKVMERSGITFEHFCLEVV